MSVPDYHEIELTISRQNVVDQIAALLYSLNIVRDDEHVMDIDFYQWDSWMKQFPITVKVKKQQELITINN